MPPQTLLKDLTHKQILALAGCISLIISWLYASGAHELSPDSLLYLFSAQTLVNHGFAAAIDVYPWPLHATLIATLHKITGLSLANAGHLLIALCYAGATCAFISLVRDLGGPTRVQLLALLVICIFPTLNDYRDYITRDAGFWLFLLLSLQQLLRFAVRNHFKHALAWFSFTLIAIGFRTEAIFFAALAPAALLIDRHISFSQRIKKSATLYGFFAGIALIGLIFVMASPQLTAKFRLVTEIANLTAFFQAMSQQLENTIALFASQTPYHFAADDMGTIFTTGLIGLVLYSLLHSLALPYVILLIWGRGAQIFADPRYKTYILAYLVIIVAYLLLLSFRKYFMADRFCVAANLLLMLALPFYIEKIWSNPLRKSIWPRIFVVLLLVYPALDSMISSGSSKQYISDTTSWLKQHKSDDEQLWTNIKHVGVLGYGCWHSCITTDPTELLDNARRDKPKWLVIQIEEGENKLLKNTQQLLKTGDWQQAISFKNETDDQALILTLSPKQD